MRFPDLRVAASAAILAAAACSDRLPLNAPLRLSTDSIPATANAVVSVTLTGAGNVARCDRNTDEATSRLLDNISGTVFTTGDNVYANGSSSDFNNCYGPSWGRHRARTRPAVGDLDYQTNGAAGYYGYFGTSAGTPTQGFYSYDLGDWHIVVLNSAIDMSVGSVQERWLRADLAARSTRCTLAYWHHPRFSSYSTYVRPEVKPLWDALYEFGAELVLNGHYRMYERFAPQTPTGAADAATGIRQITVGTGGISTNSFGTTQPNSEVRRTGVYGVLKLTLSTDTYQWQFVSVPGPTFSESGSGTCHGAAGARVAAIDVTPASGTVTAGKTMQLVADARDVSGFSISKAQVSWRSSDTLTARVVAGLVTGIAAGTAYVIATSGDVADTATVTVLPATVASVAVSPSSASVLVGQTVTLTATVADSGGTPVAGRTITWSSSAPGVATVAAGVVTGVAAGPAVITATSEGKSASATVSVTSPSPIRAGYYVSPGGSSANSGSYDRPWSLSYALAGAGGRIQAGDTVWLRDGLYPGFFRTAIRGSSSRPIVFRQFPGERSTIDGGLRVDGPDVVFWGFEIMQSTPLANGIMPTLETWGARSKFINLVIHDAAQQGITFWDGADDAEVYGCIVYNSGTHENKDHGAYVHNSSGTKTLADNVFFNNLAYGIHVYAGPNDATQKNVHVIGNVVFNNGTISNVVPEKANILVGAEVPGEGHRVIDNMLWLSGTSGRNLTIGYTASNRDVEVRGNTVWGGATGLHVTQWSSAIVANNRVGGTRDMVDLASTSLSGQQWLGNQYYRSPDANAWRYGGTQRTLTNWQLATGLGVGDVATVTLPTAPQVFVRPNKYEAGRALVVVYNWTKQSVVSADLSGVLVPGDRYEVRNVQAPFGAPVASGIYGGSILLPMTGVAPPPRLGRTTPTPPRTGPDFDSFVVTRVN
jgi:hypothetical protein